MSGLSQQITIEEFQQMMASDTQKVPSFLRKIAHVARPADVRVLSVSDEGEGDVQPQQTSWVGWKI